MKLEHKGTNNVPQNQVLAQISAPFGQQILAQGKANEADTKLRAKLRAIKADSSAEPSLTSKALFLGEIPLISKGEIGVIVALPSSGKSNVLEGIVAAYARAKDFEPLDALSFVYTAENTTIGKKILWIDTERTNNDVLFSVKRIKHRCQINPSEFDAIIDLYPFAVEITSETEAFEALKLLIETNEYDIVLIDGIFDFCPDINNIEKATSIVKAFRTLAVKHDIALVTTIHPNKGTDAIAGHLGAMLYRFSRAMLYITKEPNGLRRVTSEVGQGKLSHSSEQANAYMRWCDANGMFVTAEPIEPTVTAKYDLDVIYDIFGNNATISSKSFKIKYGEKTGLSEPAIKKHIEALKNDKVIESIGNTTNTFYKLLSDEQIPF